MLKTAQNENAGAVNSLYNGNCVVGEFSGIYHKVCRDRGGIRKSVERIAWSVVTWGGCR